MIGLENLRGLFQLMQFYMILFMWKCIALTTFQLSGTQGVWVHSIDFYNYSKNLTLQSFDSLYGPATSEC